MTHILIFLIICIILFDFLSEKAFVIAVFTLLQPKESSPEQHDGNKTLNSHSASLMTYSDCEEEDLIPMSNIVNKRT